MNHKPSIWNLIRSIIAVAFAFYVTGRQIDLFHFIGFCTVAIITKFFLELCINVQDILDELLKKNRSG